MLLPSSTSYCVSERCLYFLFHFISLNRPIIACFATPVCSFGSVHRPQETNMFFKVQRVPVNVWSYRRVVSMQYSKTSTSCSCQQGPGGRVQCSANTKVPVIATQTSFSGKTRQRRDNIYNRKCFCLVFLELGWFYLFKYKLIAFLLLRYWSHLFFNYYFVFEMVQKKKLCKCDLYISRCNFALCSK